MFSLVFFPRSVWVEGVEFSAGCVARARAVKTFDGDIVAYSVHLHSPDGELSADTKSVWVSPSDLIELVGASSFEDPTEMDLVLSLALDKVWHMLADRERALVSAVRVLESKVADARARRDREFDGCDEDGE